MREGVGVVAHTVVVGVGGLGAVLWEGVGVVAHTVVVRVGRFTGVVGEGVLAVEHPVTVRIDVEDGDFVAHDGIAEFEPVVRGDLGLPLLAGLGERGFDGGLAVVCGVVRAVNVPVNLRLTGFGVAVVVGVIVGEGQGFIGVGFRRRGDGDVGGDRCVVGWKALGDDDLRGAPGVAGVGAVAVGVQNRHVNGG